MDMAKRARRYPYAALAALLLTSCTKTVTIQVRSAEMVSSPVGRAVSYREKRAYALTGSYHSLTLTVRPDLREVIVKHEMDHAYFIMFACSNTRDEIYYLPVLVLDSDDQAAPVDGQLSGYRVLVPGDARRLARLPGGGEADLSAARKDGLCFRLGGAQMGGPRLRSNVVRAPLKIVGDAVVADAADGCGGRNGGPRAHQRNER